MPQTAESFPVEVTCTECGSSLTVTHEEAADVPGDLPPEDSSPDFPGDELFGEPAGGESTSGESTSEDPNGGLPF